MTFAEKLTKSMGTTGINQTRLAQLSGIGQTTISNLAGEKQRPYMDQALRLARALGVSLDYLADDGMDEDPHVRTPDERALLSVFRGSGLSLEEATEVIARAAADRPEKPGGGGASFGGGE